MMRIVTLAVVLLGCAQPAAAQAVDSSSAKGALRLVQLLEETGLNYEKRPPTSWIVRYKGSGGEDIPVVLAQAEDILVILNVAALGAETRESPELYRELLKFNLNADYIKTGIDDDGDFQIRADVKLASLNGTALKELLDQLASGVNQLRPLFAKHRKR
jgi:hypothetical protein